METAMMMMIMMTLMMMMMKMTMMVMVMVMMMTKKARAALASQVYTKKGRRDGRRHKNGCICENGQNLLAFYPDLPDFNSLP